MNRTIWLSTAIIILFLAFWGIRKYYILPRSYNETPVTSIEIENPVFNFDTISFDHSTYCDFKITNHGDLPLSVASPTFDGTMIHKSEPGT